MTIDWLKLLEKTDNNPDLRWLKVKHTYTTLTDEEKEVLVAFHQTCGNKQVMADGLGRPVYKTLDDIYAKFALKGIYRSVMLMRICAEILLPTLSRDQFEASVKASTSVDNVVAFKTTIPNYEEASSEPSPTSGMRLLEGTMANGMDPLDAYDKLERLIDYNCQHGFSFVVTETYVDGDLRMASIDPYTGTEFASGDE